MYGVAQVCGLSKVNNAAQVNRKAIINNAIVNSDSSYMVIRKFWNDNSGHSHYLTYTKSNKRWTESVKSAGGWTEGSKFFGVILMSIFRGTSEELIKRGYEESEISGMHYEACVKLVETLEREAQDGQQIFIQR